MKIKNIFSRNQSSFKNNFGHVLVIAGSYNMPGAGILCANAAIRSGAGLVTFAFPKSAYCVIAKNIKPEIMLLPLEEKNGRLTKKSINKIINFIREKKIDSLAVGCGMGQNSAIKSLILKIISEFKIYVVIDADGLNIFQKIQKNGTIAAFLSAKSKIIVTPHPKEFERISATPCKSENSLFRKKITKTFAKNNGIICVLKGHKTVVSDGNSVYVNNTGNAGMATAGSGDVLTGITASFICNKNKNLLLKVASAVYVHGLAGDKAALKKTQTALIASDIIENIPYAIRSIK